MSGPAGRLDAVLVCGGRWHDFDHARLQILQSLGRHERVRTRVFEDYETAGALAGADLLVTYTCDVRPTEEQQTALVDFVARGGRWLALHASNAAIDPPSEPGGQFTTPDVLGEVSRVLGSRFRGHPPIEPYRVEVTRADHPLVRGVDRFTVTDELYVSDVYEPVEVLLHTDFEGDSPGFADGRTTTRRQPVLYLREHGEGVVCYFTLGHCRGRFDVQDLGVDDLGQVDRGSWTFPEFRTVLERCVDWATGELRLS